MGPAGRRTIRRLVIGSALIVVGIAAESAGAAGQGLDRWSIDAWGALLSSSQATLETGGGAGLGVMIHVSGMDWLGVGILASQLRTQSQREGVSCLGLYPFPVGCRPDEVTETVTVRTLGFTVRPHVELMRGLRAGGGVGVSMNELNAISHGLDSDRTGNLYVPESAHMGALVDLGLTWAPIEYGPVELLIGAMSHWIFFDGCRVHPSLFAPYCGAGRLSLARAGLSFSFGS